MRHSQAKGRRSNSPANPLPIAFYGPEFRCEPAHQIVTKLMTCLRFSMPRGRFSSAETVFSPAGREMRDGAFAGMTGNATLSFRILELALPGDSRARSDPRDRCRRTLAREQIDQQQLPAVAPDDVGSDDLVRAIVGPLDQDVRSDRPDQRKRRVLVEENHEIHRCQG